MNPKAKDKMAATRAVNSICYALGFPEEETIDATFRRVLPQLSCFNIMKMKNAGKVTLKYLQQWGLENNIALRCGCVGKRPYKEECPDYPFRRKRKEEFMNPKDKSMICRMAGNIAGPLMAMATTTVSGGLANLTKEEISDSIDIVASYSLMCAMRINKLAAEKIK